MLYIPPDGGPPPQKSVAAEIASDHRTNGKLPIISIMGNGSLAPTHVERVGKNRKPSRPLRNHNPKVAAVYEKIYPFMRAAQMGDLTERNRILEALGPFVEDAAKSYSASYEKNHGPDRISLGDYVTAGLKAVEKVIETVDLLDVKTPVQLRPYMGTAIYRSFHRLVRGIKRKDDAGINESNVNIDDPALAADLVDKKTQRTDYEGTFYTQKEASILRILKAVLPKIHYDVLAAVINDPEASHQMLADELGISDINFRVRLHRAKVRIEKYEIKKNHPIKEQMEEILGIPDEVPTLRFSNRSPFSRN